MREIKLGTIGSGSIVRSILDQVGLTDRISLHAVYSRSEEKGRALADAYSCTKVSTDLDAFLSDESFNTVYIASPNLLHYEQAKRALLAGKHVLLEKPFCARAQQTRELMRIAKQHRLFLIEMAPTTFLPNYALLERKLPEIGRIRLVMSNYSQYSSRYDALRAGRMTNVFNPAYGGGCLMDINYYNVLLNTALFGKPLNAVYYPNIRKGQADTSGVMVLQYEDFVSANVGAKDTWGVNYFQIEGEEGFIYIEGGANGIASLRVVTRTGDVTLSEQPKPDRWYYEVQKVVRLMCEEDYDAAEARLAISLAVTEILEGARRKAHIVFPGDDMDRKEE